MGLSKYQKAVIKYQNTVCCCDDERMCSPCRSRDYRVFIEKELKDNMETIKFLEELKEMVTKQTTKLTNYDSPAFRALAQINANIEWHRKALRNDG